MNNSVDVKLSMFLHRYMSQSNIIDKICLNKDDNRNNMDNSFKKDLKQHFRTLRLINKNTINGDF
jgi:hypothetical protein